MNKKLRIKSANLNEIANIIYRNLDKNKEKGWFSRFVSEALIDKYSKDFKQKILMEKLLEATKLRDKQEKIIHSIAEELKKVKKWMNKN